MNEGTDPPADLKIPDDIHPESYPPCKKCGASNGMGIKNMQTGMIDPLGLCHDCLNAIIWNPPEFNDKFKKAFNRYEEMKSEPR